MATKMVALINNKAGVAAPKSGDPACAKIAHLLNAAGAGEVLFVDPDHYDRALQEAVNSKPEILVVGGGDGTIGTAARFLTGTPITLGVLPLGTLNHFARELGVPEKLENAIESLSRCRTRTIDTGEVNGKVFVNNSSIGIYPEALILREKLRSGLGLGKYAAMTYAVLKHIWEYTMFDIQVEIQNLQRMIKTPFLFVGNNRYEPRLLAEAGRPSLSEGILSIRYTEEATRFQLLRLLVHTLTGEREMPDLRTLASPELTVKSRRTTLHVALDGEVCRMHTPLRYRCLPQSLRVLVPDQQ